MVPGAGRVNHLLGGPLDGQVRQLDDSDFRIAFARQEVALQLSDDIELLTKPFAPVFWGIYRRNRFGAYVWQGYPDSFDPHRTPERDRERLKLRAVRMFREHLHLGLYDHPIA